MTEQGTENRRVYDLSFDKDVGERGAIRTGYDGESIPCPNCNEKTNLHLLINKGECIQCGLEMNVYIEYREDTDG